MSSAEPTSDRFEGPLAIERAIMNTASRQLERLSRADCTGFSREELADHSLAIATAAERVRVISARFMAVSEDNACSLTKGSRSMTALVNRNCGVSRRQGTTMALIGSAPDRYPLFYRALLEGRIGPGHIEVLHPIWRKVDRNHFNMSESALVDLAGLCTPEEFADYLNEWRNHADEDAALDEFITQQGAQHCHYGFDLFGSLHYSGTVGPLHAEPFIDTLQTHAQQHHAEDATPSQALGDALVQLVINPNGNYRAHLEVLVPEHHTDGGAADRSTAAVPDAHDRGFSTRYWPRTARGTLIPPKVVNHLRSTGARVTEHTVDSDGNIATDLPGSRHFTTAQKRLIRLRDNHCQHPGCRTTTCDYDHVEPFEHGGPTLIRNGQLLCRFHHRWKHRHDPGPHRPTQFDDTPATIPLE